MTDRKLIVSNSSTGQFLMYVLLIGVTVIAYKKTDFSDFVTRCIQGVQVLLFGYLLVSCARQGKLKLSRFDAMVHVWWMVWLGITIYNNSEAWLSTIRHWMTVSTFLLIGVKYWRDDIERSFRLLALVFSCLVYLNAFLLLLFPDGLWIDTAWIGDGDTARYLFGNYNAMGSVSLCALIVHGAYTFFSNKWRKNLYALAAVSLFTVIFVGSKTSLVGLGLMALYMLFHKSVRHPFAIMGVFAFLYVAFIVLIVFMGGTIESYPFALWFVENVLGKDASFTARTIIWISTIGVVLLSPWIGYGCQPVEWNVLQIGASGPHNLWLELMMYGGIIAVSGFLVLIIQSMISIYRSNTTAATVVAVGLCVLMLMSLFETYSMILIFLVLQIAYYTIYFSKPTTDKLC